MSTPLFVATCDLAAKVRGRAVPASAADSALTTGTGWVPANLGLTCFGPIADGIPFGSDGDLRLRPDPTSLVHWAGEPGHPGLALVLADQVTTSGEDWDCCPRSFARRAIADLAAAGLRIVASFEHEFTLSGQPTADPMSLARFRAGEPVLGRIVDALTAMNFGPENILPEYGEDQYEVTVRPAEGIAAADRAVWLRETVRDLAGRHGRTASFAPLVTAEGTGSGVHLHFSLAGDGDVPALYDPARPGGLSALGARFAAGILARAPALVAVSAPSPVSGIRLGPHRWSAAAAFLGEQNREALLRIAPLSPLTGVDPARAYNLEFRAADGTGNPYLLLGLLIRAGLAGLADGHEAVVISGSVDQARLSRLPSLPASPAAALAALEADEDVRRWLGDDLTTTFLAVRRAELAALSGASVAEQVRRIRAQY